MKIAKETSNPTEHGIAEQARKHGRGGRLTEYRHLCERSGRLTTLTTPGTRQGPTPLPVARDFGETHRRPWRLPTLLGDGNFDRDLVSSVPSHDGHPWSTTYYHLLLLHTTHYYLLPPLLTTYYYQLLTTTTTDYYLLLLTTYDLIYYYIPTIHYFY